MEHNKIVELLNSDIGVVKGIGEKKKQELLKKFGSIEGVKKADILEISKIKGITEELAKNIKKELLWKL